MLKNNIIQKSLFPRPPLLKLKKKREWQDFEKQQEKQLKKGTKRKNDEDVDLSKRRKKNSDAKGNNNDLDGNEKISEKKGGEGK